MIKSPTMQQDNVLSFLIKRIFPFIAFINNRSGIKKVSNPCFGADFALECQVVGLFNQNLFWWKQNDGILRCPFTNKFEKHVINADFCFVFCVVGYLLTFVRIVGLLYPFVNLFLYQATELIPTFQKPIIYPVVRRNTCITPE